MYSNFELHLNPPSVIEDFKSLMDETNVGPTSSVIHLGLSEAGCIAS